MFYLARYGGGLRSLVDFRYLSWLGPCSGYDTTLSRHHIYVYIIVSIWVLMIFDMALFITFPMLHAYAYPTDHY